MYISGWDARQDARWDNHHISVKIRDGTQPPHRSIRPTYGPQFPSLLARGNYCYGDMYFVK